MRSLANMAKCEFGSEGSRRRISRDGCKYPSSDNSHSMRASACCCTSETGTLAVAVSVAVAACDSGRDVDRHTEAAIHRNLRSDDDGDGDGIAIAGLSHRR